MALDGEPSLCYRQIHRYGQVLPERRKEEGRRINGTTKEHTQAHERHVYHEGGAHVRRNHRDGEHDRRRAHGASGFAPGADEAASATSAGRREEMSWRLFEDGKQALHLTIEGASDMTTDYGLNRMREAVIIACKLKYAQNGNLYVRNHKGQIVKIEAFFDESAVHEQEEGKK